jgi:hypothetical protein
MLEEIERRAMPAFREGTKIVPTALGDDVGLFGAVAVVLQNYDDAMYRRQELARNRVD